MNKIFLIASTHLHLIDAIAIASTKEEDCYLFFIDRTDHEDIYFTSLKKWKNHPFKAIEIFVTNKYSLFTKIYSKSQTIKSLLIKFHKHQPSHVIVGNDRKNEISALIGQIKEQTSIEYMDDGLHSYINEKSSIFKYSFLDTLFKQLIYQYPIETPKFIGANKYIQKIYLFKPEFRNSSLQNKKTEQINISFLQSKSFLCYVNLIITQLNIDFDTILTNIKGIIFLPHPKELNPQKIKIILDKIKNKNIAIKLHPRDLDNKKLFEKNQITIISNLLSAEILFLNISPTISIYGFKTTVLLMAKWLRSDLNVYNLQFRKNKITDIEILMKKNNINLININNINF